MSRCSNCPYSSFGSRDSSSDICDDCIDDPDTGWGGSTDHSIGKHFNSDEEREEYYNIPFFDDYEDYEDFLEW